MKPKSKKILIISLIALIFVALGFLISYWFLLGVLILMILKMDFFKKQYGKCFKYLKDSWKPIIYIVAIFFAFALIGFFVPAPAVISSTISGYINNLLEKTQNFGFSQMFSFIFFNNLKTSFFGLIIGLLFGVFSIFTALGNGYVLGFVSAKSVMENGTFVLWRIFPHGIFELPAVFIALGLGLKLGTFFLNENKSRFLKENLGNSLRVFLLIILPLLLIAAFIETILIFFV